MGGNRQPRRPAQTQNKPSFDLETNRMSARSPGQNGSEGDSEVAQLRAKLDEIREWLEVVKTEALGELDEHSALIYGQRLLELETILNEENVGAD